MSDVRVVWMAKEEVFWHESPRGVIDGSPYLLLPIERTEDGAVVVRVGEWTLRREDPEDDTSDPICRHGNERGIYWVTNPADEAIITAAERAMEGER